MEGDKKPLVIRGVEVPNDGTEACRDYFISCARVESFLHFVLFMASHIDYSVEVAHKALVETARSDEEKASLTDGWEKRVKMVDQIKRRRQFLMEVVVTRHVENYLNYLSSLLFAIFVQRPETLRSSEQVALETVLKHESMDALIGDIAERKIQTLSYSSFEELSKFFRDKFNLVLADDAATAKIVEAIETRNLSAHNRCIVNRRYVSRTGASDSEVGKKKSIFLEYVERLVPLLGNSVKSVDLAARERLKLRGIAFDMRELLEAED